MLRMNCKLSQMQKGLEDINMKIIYGLELLEVLNSFLIPLENDKSDLFFEAFPYCNILEPNWW